MWHRGERRARCILLVALGCAALSSCRLSTPIRVSFAQSSHTVEAYDFVEVTARIPWPRPKNPFLDASLSGSFQLADGSRHWQVNGFCDADDGSIFKIRFMPPAPGDYNYEIRYQSPGKTATSSGSFHVTDGHRRGPIRVDSHYPWHFVWEGTGEHYFFNGTTAYWLMGWSDEKIIQATIERLHRLKINRIRVTLAGRTKNFVGEPVMVGPNWSVYLTPWPSKLPEDVFHPGFDYSRFYLPLWQKFDRALAFARDRDMIISVVLDMNESVTHPAAGSQDERLFLRYAIARFGAFSNITWDLGDDLERYRSDRWTHQTGTLVEQWDPYHHLATSHPVDKTHQDRAADWFGFASLQDWSRRQHEIMLQSRSEQQAAGRIIPQTNEEYGYEDHYPPWSEGLGSDSADTLRRMAWEISMAGAYQTTGETARRGTNIWPDTGGGWMNGRGDDTMTMLQGYAHMVDFFTSFDWWRTNPADDLLDPGHYCLALPGQIYAVYLPVGGRFTLHVAQGEYAAAWFNPRTGDSLPGPAIKGTVWSAAAPDQEGDWALLLRRK